MAGKGQYKTKQREELLRYLRKNPGAHFTARDLSRHFESQGCPIGTATIYRQLDGMIEEGLVHKYHHRRKLQRLLRLCGPGGPLQKTHLLPLQVREVRAADPPGLHGDRGAPEHWRSTMAIAIDPTRTVFYGVCADCRAAE
jgi:Fur family ferric uptake transcriptional regulator